MVPSEHGDFGWLQEEIQLDNSRSRKDISGTEDDMDRGLAQRFKGPVKQGARLE